MSGNKINLACKYIEREERMKMRERERKRHAKSQNAIDETMSEREVK